MLEITDNCDACDEADTWNTDNHLYHDHGSNCGTRHVIPEDTEEAFRHKEKPEAECKEMLGDLRTWYEEVSA